MLQTVHFRLTSVAQKRCCLSSLFWVSVKRGVRDSAGAGAGAEFGLYHTVLGLVLGLGSGKGLIGLASTLILKQHSVKKVDHEPDLDSPFYWHPFLFVPQESNRKRPVLTRPTVFRHYLRRLECLNVPGGWRRDSTIDVLNSVSSCRSG